MSEDVMFNQALEALQQGQRGRARDLLTRLLRADQGNPRYWLWLSATVDTRREQIYCLQTALRLDPSNRAARQGLVLLGALPAQDVTPAPLHRREWRVPLFEVHQPNAWERTWANPWTRLAALVLAIALLCTATVVGFYVQSARQRPVVVRIPTNTPGPTPTFTFTPTAINETPRPTVTLPPTPSGPLPLWMLLEATYTPTPRYVNTPHPPE